MDHKHQIVDYRNATYFGRINKLSREGNGILITDDSYILLANWNDNLIDGPYIYLFDGNFIVGTSHEGKLQKFNLIITPSVKIYANYKNNHIHQKCIIEDENGIKMFNFENGKKVTGGVDVPYSKLKQYVWREFGEEILDIPSHIERFLQREEVRNITRIRSVRISEHFQYYGSLNEDGDCDGLGFVMNIQNSQIYSSGNYKNGALHGLGRTNQGQKLIVDGVFQNGDFKGSGVVYNIAQNNYTFHNSQEPVYGDPTLKIRQIRKEFHLRSLRFFNQIIMIASIIKIRISQITNQHQKSRSNYKVMSIQNTQRQFNRSPYKITVHESNSKSQYDYQSNYIQDSPSPIRKINNLAPSKTKAKKEEFRIDVDREAKSISSMSKKSLTDNHFNKETKELVRDLEVEGNKRIDLHEIYRQTKLRKVKKM